MADFELDENGSHLRLILILTHPKLSPYEDVQDAREERAS